MKPTRPFPFPRAARLLVALAVLVSVAAVAVLAIGPERVPMAALVQYLPFPALLAPAVAAVGASWLLGWRWRLASLCALGLVLVPVMGLQLHWREGHGDIRVMTHNVKSYLGEDRPDWPLTLAVEIARHDPDILVMQDARRLERMPAQTLQAVLGGRRWQVLGQYVVASRLPLRDCGLRDIAIDGARHTFAACVVEIAGREVDLITAHLQTPREGLNAVRFTGLLDGADTWQENVEQRLQQAAALADHARTARRPVIVAGDLNAPPDSMVLRTLEATGLRNAFSMAGRGYGYTYGHGFRLGFSFLRLDHILVGPQFRVARCVVGGAEASPHRPVVADLALEESRS